MPESYEEKVIKIIEKKNAAIFVEIMEFLDMKCVSLVTETKKRKKKNYNQMDLIISYFSDQKKKKKCKELVDDFPFPPQFPF